MDNTFSDGDVLWAKKFTLQKSIERYSVIIAKVNRKLVIKRIVGLPEEKIKILNGYVFVNGQQLENDYGYQTNISGIANKELVLEDNQYFLLGDNRNCSIDSRIWGAINLDQIKGIVIYRFFPFWKMQSIH